MGDKPMYWKGELKNIELAARYQAVSFSKIRLQFVGDVFDENEKRHPDYWQIIKKSMGN